MNRRKFFSALPFAAVGGAVGLSSIPAQAAEEKKEVMLGPDDYYELRCERENWHKHDPENIPDWPECEGTFRILKSQSSAICPRCGFAQDLYKSLYRHIYK
jgi:hypothetical protein